LRQQQQQQQRSAVPLRFVRAAKQDGENAQRAFDDTLAWRKQHSMDTILYQPAPHFHLIKQNYPHCFHLRSKFGEPVFYEKPAQGDIKTLLSTPGLTMDTLLLHYASICEFGWQCLERDDLAKSVTVFDLQNVKLSDFAGANLDFVRKASAFTSQHYPERVGHVHIIHVPSWFKRKHASWSLHAFCREKVPCSPMFQAFHYLHTLIILFFLLSSSISNLEYSQRIC